MGLIRQILHESDDGLVIWLIQSKRAMVWRSDPPLGIETGQAQDVRRK
jgi:hypothetical protein